jgi:DNA-binding MarR family transcriptional regulator
MESTKEVINDLLVEVFNHILSIEQHNLRKRGVKISMNEVHVLEAITKTKEPTMTHIANRLRVTVGTLTTAINRLVEKGYVQRERLASDKRRVIVSITKKARDVLKIHDQFHDEMIEATIRDMKLDQDENLIQALSNLKAYFRNHY